MATNKFLYFFLTFLLLMIPDLNKTFAQKKYYPIAFYNVENLFDTIKDVKNDDTDFTPDGKYEWTKSKYNKKISNIAKVIGDIGLDKNKSGAVIIGLAEVENKTVIEDILKQKKLSKSNYQIVHKESPDSRGIDVALIYNPSYFELTSYKTYAYTLPGRNNIKTRDILVVTGILANEPVSILVNHWSSRGGENSAPLRERSAAICKQIADSIYNANKKAKIIIMGDLNDDPQDISTRVVLNAKKNKSEVLEGGLYNTMWSLHSKGFGSLRHKGRWNLFDQIIISHSLLTNNPKELRFEYAKIFSKDYLFQKTEQNKSYPYRTFSGNTFIKGYSDHLPTLIYLTKENYR